jgi:hypothetical protein
MQAPFGEFKKLHGRVIDSSRRLGEMVGLHNFIAVIHY